MSPLAFSLSAVVLNVLLQVVLARENAIDRRAGGNIPAAGGGFVIMLVAKGEKPEPVDRHAMALVVCLQLCIGRPGSPLPSLQPRAWVVSHWR
jgi:hypothetical protein